LPHPDESNLLDVLAAAIASLRSAKAPYMIIGAWALSVWGRPRATMDLDFMVMVDDSGLDRLRDLLTPKGFSTDQTWAEWNPLLRGSQLRMQFRGVTVDLMRPRDVHDNHAFERRKRKRLVGRLYSIIAPEDFILQKLKAGRPRDFEDALSVLERSREMLDIKYLEQWAGRLGLKAEWDYLLGE
jgi:hypothetical protein